MIVIMSLFFAGVARWRSSHLRRIYSFAANLLSSWDEPGIVWDE
jgi:hypothetical protein